MYTLIPRTLCRRRQIRNATRTSAIAPSTPPAIAPSKTPLEEDGAGRGVCAHEGASEVTVGVGSITELLSTGLGVDVSASVLRGCALVTENGCTLVIVLGLVDCVALIFDVGEFVGWGGNWPW
jgi:hypothetical protein